MAPSSIFIVLPFLSLIFLSPAAATASARYSPADVKTWCGRLPYPQPCEYFLTNNNYNPTAAAESATAAAAAGIDISHFKKMAMELALNRAVVAERNTATLGSRCRSGAERAAWADCVELYEATVLRLSETVSPGQGCTQEDAQTWLSTALTNLDTCIAGFRDLGVPDYVLPLMSNNVSKLISNTLALNKEAVGGGSGGSGGVPPPSYSHRGGFPTWLKPGDRKLLQASGAPRADVVVAKDGSGNFKTVKEAVAAAAKRSGSRRYVIYVKAGVYAENVEMGSKVKNVMMVGDGMGKTIITGSKSVGGGSTTFKSATFAVVGDGFIARGITFRNTAGPRNHQAVALRSGSDLSVFYQCSFEGYQDTLYVHSDRQFYRDCDIYGTVDFIFGNAAVVFQNCNIYARDPPNKTNTITAQGRTDPNQNTGISIHNCRVGAAADLRPVQSSVKTYLGRPWKAYSRTVFMRSQLDGLVHPAGWMEWSGNFALDTLYYGEYMNTGPGSSTRNRVKWRGYRVISSAAEASKFTVGNFIAGGSWLPATRVPFAAGL